MEPRIQCAKTKDGVSIAYGTGEPERAESPLPSPYVYALKQETRV